MACCGESSILKEPYIIQHSLAELKACEGIARLRIHEHHNIRRIQWKKIQKPLIKYSGRHSFFATAISSLLWPVRICVCHGRIHKTRTRSRLDRFWHILWGNPCRPGAGSACFRIRRKSFRYQYRWIWRLVDVSRFSPCVWDQWTDWKANRLPPYRRTGKCRFL